MIDAKQYFFNKLDEFKKKQIIEKQQGINDFNILSIIRNKNEEVGLHSNLIYSLLNPNENHNQGELFLRLFIRNVLFIEEFNEEEIISVEREDLTSKNRRIDFTIESTSYIIGIEMKTTYYTEDQPKQLSHYKDELDDRNKKYNNSKIVIIYYLTLNGKDASPESIKDENNNLINYKKASFKIDMLNWITNCHKEVSSITNLAILLTQYRDIILQISSPVNYKSNLTTLDKFMLNDTNKMLMLDTLFTIDENDMQEYKKEILQAKGQMLYKFFYSFNTNEKFKLENINAKIKEDKKRKKLVYTKSKCMDWFKKEKVKNFGTFYKLDDEYLVYIFIGIENLHYGIVRHENHVIKNMHENENSDILVNLEFRSWNYLKWYSCSFKLLDNLDIFLDYDGWIAKQQKYLKNILY